MLTATVLLSAVGSFVSLAVSEEGWIFHGLMLEPTVLSASLLPSGEDSVLRVWARAEECHFSLSMVLYWVDIRDRGMRGPEWNKV